jgi:hypothetical protein
MSKIQKLPARHMEHPMQGVHGDTVIEDKSDEEMEAALARRVVEVGKKLNDDSIDMALRVLEAQQSLEWSLSHLKVSWLDWSQEAEQALKDLRMLRMAFTNEGKLILQEAKDIRKFFLDETHQVEIAQLKEFVDVCERLEGLKKRGTLDALVDVILKLATANK